MEDKMKKRQEMQQEINHLNQQLRQRQIEQRKQQQINKNSTDDLLGGKTTSGRQRVGLSQVSMQAMISADSSMKQAKVQGSTVVQMKGKTGVLESEIKTDKGRGANTEKKEEELDDFKNKTQTSSEAQVSALADADKKMMEAAKEESKTETEQTKEKGNDPEANTKNVDMEAGTETSKIVITQAGQVVTQRAVYIPIDVCL